VLNWQKLVRKRPPLFQALIGVLKDNDPVVRRLAAYALGEIGPASKPALPALKEMMNDPDREVVMQVGKLSEKYRSERGRQPQK